MGKAIVSGFAHYFDFKGRASRSEYWWFVLFVMLVGVLSIFVDMVLGTSLEENSTGFVEAFWNLITFIPSISVCARRLHDVNKSGWWMLLSITIIGIPVVLYWTIKKGDEGANRFGLNECVSESINA